MHRAISYCYSITMMHPISVSVARRALSRGIFRASRAPATCPPPCAAVRRIHMQGVAPYVAAAGDASSESPSFQADAGQPPQAPPSPPPHGGAGPAPTRKRLSARQHALLDSMLRVNQAGELGANTIYLGQLAVLGRRAPHLRPLLTHMWEQEKHHLDTFNALLPAWRARPSLLHPVWHAAGYAVGVASALLGKEAAMTCTEAVETVIGGHYNDQIRELVALVEDPENANLERRDEILNLIQTIKQFRDEELEHLDTAVQHDAHKAPAYTMLNSVIQAGCTVAIAIAKRV